jgi:hypothetical protein
MALQCLKYPQYYISHREISLRPPIPSVISHPSYQPNHNAMAPLCRIIFSRTRIRNYYSAVEWSFKRYSGS